MEIIKYPSRSVWSKIIERPHIEAATLSDSVARILDDVRLRGDIAVKEYVKQFQNSDIDTTEVSVGAAFLGRLDGNGLNFTSAGAVPGEATSISDEGNNNPYFINYLPVTITLGQITVSGDDDSVFMTPTEYLQVLDPNGAYVTARYTYISKEYLDDEYEEEAPSYYSLIGWWERGHVGEEGYNRNNVELKPGFGFLGRLDGNGLKFNFPAAYTK